MDKTKPRKAESMYITRAQESLVLRYSSIFKVVAVTGPRQVGKTTMLRHLIEVQDKGGHSRNYVSLDNTAQRQLAKSDPELFLQRFRPPVLIDEIQYAPELLPYIKLAVDESDETGLFWITGSQPFHLMRHVSETLAGRVGIVEMLGLSNAERAGAESEPFLPSPSYFERRVQATHELGSAEVFSRICAGSFPGIATLPEDVRPAAYDALVDTYLMRDIRDLSQVADEMKFGRFLVAVASLTARPVVYAELARMADVDQKTAKAWLSLLVSSYLVKVVQPYANSILKRLVKQPVMHFTDLGLAAHLAGWSTPRALEMGASSGHFFESYVFGEIYKSFVNAGRRPPIWFFRSNDRREIDFLLEMDGVLYPVEVKQGANPVEHDARHFKALGPLEAENLPLELASLRREVGVGTIVCLNPQTYPINRSVWTFPAWAI